MPAQGEPVTLDDSGIADGGRADGGGNWNKRVDSHPPMVP
jgi:hypothetical protein